MDFNLQQPYLHKGNKFRDARGTIQYNNDFDFASIKRMYIMENATTDMKRGWQGHKIEQRWFSALKGGFVIRLKPILAFEDQTNDYPNYEFTLKEGTLDYLHVPAGYASCIQALEEDSKLLLLADYAFGEVVDEWRFELE